MSNQIDRFTSITGQEVVDQLYQLAYPLHGIRVTHVSSTAQGGGVAEILTKMVPLMQALGIETRWEIIQGSNEFFQCTKSFHNALQGNRILIPAEHLRIFEETNKRNAETLNDTLQESDIVIIHDPQPLTLIDHFPQRKGKWIWRCHIDASHPFRSVWKYLIPFIEQFDATIFSLAEFTHPLSKPMFIIPPSIDPFSDKNVDLSQKEIDGVYTTFGIDPKRPFLLQVSRYDKFKDPIGVLESYRFVKKFNPGVQLVLVGGGASDDPEGELLLEEVRKSSSGDGDTHILLLPNDAHRTINALQRAADIILQKSIREGFGLTVTEGLWKSKPVIGGNTGGIKLQLINGETGFVVNTPEGAAYRARYLLQHPEKGRELGARGREYVRENFLITRQIRDYLGLIYSLLFEETDRIELPPIYEGTT